MLGSSSMMLLPVGYYAKILNRNDCNEKQLVLLLADYTEENKSFIITRQLQFSVMFCSFIHMNMLQLLIASTKTVTVISIITI
jgi:hypothetical protein